MRLDLFAARWHLYKQSRDCLREMRLLPEYRGELTPYCQRTSAVRAKDAVTTGFANGSEAESRSSKAAADIIERQTR